MTNRPLRRSLIVLALLACGCYVPAPRDPGSLALNDDLRVLLSLRGREALNGTPLDDRGELRGRLLRLTDDSLTIGTRLPVSASAGMALNRIRQPVTFARADVLQVSVPTLDRGRTGLLAGATLVVLALLVTDLFDIRGDGSTDPPPPPPDNESPFAIRR